MNSEPPANINGVPTAPDLTILPLTEDDQRWWEEHSQIQAIQYHPAGLDAEVEELSCPDTGEPFLSIAAAASFLRSDTNRLLSAGAAPIDLESLLVASEYTEWKFDGGYHDYTDEGKNFVIVATGAGLLYIPVCETAQGVLRSIVLIP